MAGFADISEMSPQLQLMIGTGSHLDPAELDPLIMLASLTIMKNAGRANIRPSMKTRSGFVFLLTRAEVPHTVWP
jgi:hypothetical protein